MTSSRSKWAPYGFLLPFSALFVCVYAVPIGYAIWESLQKITRSGGSGVFGGGGVAKQVFGGFVNYSSVIHSSGFWTGLLRVTEFGCVQVPVMLILATALALALDTGRARFPRLFRLAYFLPYAVPGVIAAILWGFLYTPGVSPISQALAHTPIGNVNLLNHNIVLFAIGNIVTWSWTGYNMLIIFSALQAIPQELFEAAKIDRASEWQIATRIKLPMLKPALLLTTVFSIIGTLQLFTEPSVFQKITNGITSNYTPNLMAYTAAFLTNDPYFAAAISVTLAAITFVLSFGVMRLTWRRSIVT